MLRFLTVRGMLAACLIFATTAYAPPPGLMLDTLPAGASVTLPQPATMLLRVKGTAVLAANDFPQSVRVSVVANTGSMPRTVVVEVFDRLQDRVRRVEVSPGAPFVYNLGKLSTVIFKAAAQKGAGDDPTTLVQFESDKPLTVTR